VFHGDAVACGAAEGRHEERRQTPANESTAAPATSMNPIDSPDWSKAMNREETNPQPCEPERPLAQGREEAVHELSELDVEALRAVAGGPIIENGL